LSEYFSIITFVHYLLSAIDIVWHCLISTWQQTLHWKTPPSTSWVFCRI